MSRVPSPNSEFHVILLRKPEQAHDCCHRQLIHGFRPNCEQLIAFLKPRPGREAVGIHMTDYKLFVSRTGQSDSNKILAVRQSESVSRIECNNAATKI